MDKPKTYRVANVRVDKEGNNYWLEVYLMLLDNSEHRKFQVGGFSVEIPDEKNSYPISGPTGETSIITYVGGSEKHKYTRFSMPIGKPEYKLIQEKAMVRFKVEDLSEKGHFRHNESISMVNGMPQDIDRVIWIKE